MSSPRRFPVPPRLPGAAHPTVSIEAQAIRFVRCDSSQVFSGTSMPVHQTARTSHFDREVQSKPWVPDVVLALPFPLVCLGGVCKRNREYRARMSSSTRKRVAAALLMASEVACSSKATRADARMTKRLASSSPSSTTFGTGTTSPCSISCP